MMRILVVMTFVVSGTAAQASPFKWMKQKMSGASSTTRSASTSNGKSLRSPAQPYKELQTVTKTKSAPSSRFTLGIEEIVANGGWVAFGP